MLYCLVPCSPSIVRRVTRVFSPEFRHQLSSRVSKYIFRFTLFFCFFSVTDVRTTFRTSHAIKSCNRKFTSVWQINLI